MISQLKWLNRGGKASEFQLKKIEEVLSNFLGKITVLEVGSAYGGAVEEIAKISKRINVYGYDTFEGHPKDLSKDVKSVEAVCMDYWYRSDVFGTSTLDYDFQLKVLKSLKLNNAHLVKGRINEKSFGDLDKIHFAMLDMDLIVPTRIAYEALAPKIVQGGYMMFHDYGENHLPLLLAFVDNVVIPSGLWEIESHKEDAFIFLKKK